ncbi:MAG TPA: FAD-binding protein, partial [Anaerolineae bacterium]|nr:FAD-binding protein [Anaerolineae bacterium]
ELPVNKTALVVGGGIAGMTCALSTANQGHDVYLVPLSIGARLTAALIKRLPDRLSMLALPVVLYGAVYVWGGLDEYRILLLNFIFISILLTVSLNLVNGYMGEFSCASGGFMAVGAYVASVLTVGGFVHDDVFGPPLLPPALGPFLFPIALIIGGLVTALSSLLVAIPAFRTRGDYLAIITLAYTFIMKSLFENLEVIGGPRGFMNQPKWASLPVIFAWTIVGVWIMRNYVSSTFGKGAQGVRDDWTAADVMTVNPRRVKMITFMLSAFWSGVAGGLFAHVMGYINPATFGIMKTAEVMAMLYMGGLNSISGSIVGAVLYQLLIEALRPLGIVKWMVIPAIIIIFMLRRPWGLISFTEFRFLRKEVGRAPASD